MKSRTRTRRSHNSRRRLTIESLETRAVPATWLGFYSVSYQDVDGDEVIVNSSKPIFTSEATANVVLTFDSFFNPDDNSIPQQLQSIDLTKLPNFGAGAAGTVLKVTAKPGRYPGQDGWHRQKGDGMANVGYINATGIDLREVNVSGDLGGITAGDSTTSTPGLGKLKAHSMGVLIEKTQGQDRNAESLIRGPLSSMKTDGDFANIRLKVQGMQNTPADGKIGKLDVGGSLVGNSSDLSGLIQTTGDVGSANIDGSLLGGNGNDSGELYVLGTIGKTDIGGSLVGGIGIRSGRLAAGAAYPIHVNGNLIGGKGDHSGQISTVGFTTITVDGSLLGNDGMYSGTILATGTGTGVTVSRDLQGGTGDHSGAIEVSQFQSANRSLTVNIGNSIAGGLGKQSGQVLIGTGQDPAGATGIVAAINVGGDVRGGAGTDSGEVFSFRSVGKLNVKGSIVGGGGERSGRVVGGGPLLGKAEIGGNVVGGGGQLSGVFGGNTVIKAHVDGSVRGGLVQAGTFLDLAIDGSVVSSEISAIPVNGVDGAMIVKLKIGGRVENSLIAAKGPDASIVDIKVGGDWVASNAVAGVLPGPDGNYGTADDTLEPNSQVSLIKSIDIKGAVLGTPDNTLDHFAFAAKQMASLFVNDDMGFKPDNRLVGPTGDVRIVKFGTAPIAEATFNEAPTASADKRTLKYRDVDGDFVIVKFTKPVVTAATFDQGNANRVFFFKVMPNGGRQLQLIDLRNLAANPNDPASVAQAVNDLAMLIEVDRDASPGDGFVNIGRIDATGANLGGVGVTGDLGKINAGNEDAKRMAAVLLGFHSMGRLGTSTQDPNSSPDLLSTLKGGFTQIKLEQDLAAATVLTTGDHGAISKVDIGGSLIGGSGYFDPWGSGVIAAEQGIGTVKIAGNLEGGTGSGAGRIVTGAKPLETLGIKGSIFGTPASSGGQVDAFYGIGTAVVGHDLIDGSIASGYKTGFVGVAGSVIRGSIFSIWNMGSFAIGHDLVGGDKANSGRVTVASATIAKTGEIGGSIVGGSGDDSGSVFVKGDCDGGLFIGQDIRGGSGVRSGEVEVQLLSKSIVVFGSVIGGTADFSGRIRGGELVKNLYVGGDLIGGSVALDASSDAAGSIQADKINGLKIDGSVLSGRNTGIGFLSRSGQISGDLTLGTVIIKGSVRGNPTQPVVIAANRSIGSVNIDGSAVFANILSGAEAQQEKPFTIGSVSVGGNWMASNISAGVFAGDDSMFGTADDLLYNGGSPTSIGSVEIGGQAIGSTTPGQHYGIVSQQIAEVKINGQKQGLNRFPKFGLNPGPGNDEALVGVTGDMSIREVTASM